MGNIHHLNCVSIESPIGAKAIGHCLLLEDGDRLALIDAGIGLADIRQKEQRLGGQLIEMVGFKFNEEQTAFRQIEKMGFNARNVKHCIVTHLDPDHIGALVDFPDTQIHVSTEEMENFKSGNPRYLPIQLAHQPSIKTYPESDSRWNGFELRKVDLGMEFETYLVPLWGHTLGHCGVLIKQGDHWLFHIGDAYYYRMELETDQHPVSQLATLRADDNSLRLKSLEQIRTLERLQKNISIISYHDPSEFLQKT